MGKGKGHFSVDRQTNPPQLRHQILLRRALRLCTKVSPNDIMAVPTLHCLPPRNFKKRKKRNRRSQTPENPAGAGGTKHATNLGDICIHSCTYRAMSIYIYYYVAARKPSRGMKNESRDNLKEERQKRFRRLTSGARRCWGFPLTPRPRRPPRSGLADRTSHRLGRRWVGRRHTCSPSTSALPGGWSKNREKRAAINDIVLL